MNDDTHVQSELLYEAGITEQHILTVRCYAIVNRFLRASGVHNDVSTAAIVLAAILRCWRTAKP